MSEAVRLFRKSSWPPWRERVLPPEELAKSHESVKIAERWAKKARETRAASDREISHNNFAPEMARALSTRRAHW